jgi:hypothetical protein
MIDEQEQDDDNQMVGHSSTTIPGGEKELSGDPGRTPGKAEGEEEDVEE